jgi:hypothetical protein
MIRGHDTHNIDIVPIEDIAVIFVGVCFALPDFVMMFRSICVTGVNVTDRYDIAKLRVPHGVSGPHTSGSNAANLRAIISRFVRK